MYTLPENNLLLLSRIIQHYLMCLIDLKYYIALLYKEPPFFFFNSLFFFFFLWVFEKMYNRWLNRQCIPTRDHIRHHWTIILYLANFMWFYTHYARTLDRVRSLRVVSEEYFFLVNDFFFFSFYDFGNGHCRVIKSFVRRARHAMRCSRSRPSSSLLRFAPRSASYYIEFRRKEAPPSPPPLAA